MKEQLIINGQGDTKDIQQSSLISHPDKKHPFIEPQKWLQSAIEDQRQRTEMDVSQNEATVKIQTGLPWVGIFFTGDWHLGSDKVNYELWDHHQTLVLETPGLYEAIVGDERDNFVLPKFHQGLFEGVWNPEQQAEFITWWLFHLDEQDKVIARCGGNHDGWTFSQSGLNLETLWSKQMKSPLLRTGGFVHTFFNEVKYDLYLHHGLSIFNSTFNPNHATKRAYEFQGKFDVGAMGHTHVSEIAHGWRNNDSQQHDYVQIRTGTYKMDDQYARSKQLGRGQPPGATVLFNTKNREMMPFANLEVAVKVLESLNK
jgi:hypothetical protein